ncbi:helix-turn-helix domain-containing protein [Streptomyces hirsutus]|uniref:helix-turn-helix domain-containing protein n=1 Tax=Streptomyces hirsutus TaxID=35620 RepID=UPI00340E0112
MSDVSAAGSGRSVRLVVQAAGRSGSGGGRGEGEFLLRPDGSLVIPAPLAREVLRVLVRDLSERVRSDGGEVSPAVRGVLRALHLAAKQPRDGAGAFAAETPADQGVSVREVTAEQAAGLLGCSPQYARRLARSGRVAARRVGPVWLIDRASLDAFRTGDAL